ncbi:sensor histidine kinase [Amycolatopsis nigrescens]|uniref:sensor histidine kinase n=1 Tax=Amycolatopsis nigrescens TaxID=381445 RepID=UPI00035E529B|nr:sensor histidine kinase [Amycolatopsis nigrescens]
MHLARLRALLPLRDLAFAAGFGICVIFGTIGAATLQADRSRAMDFWAYLLIVLAVVATLGLRRTAPVWALAGGMLSVSVYLFEGYPYGPVQLCMVIGMFEVARLRPLRVSLPACGLAAAAASATVLVRLIGDTPLPLTLAWMGWIVLPWSLGALLHMARSARERSRQELVTRVALEERIKVAGEVHDVAGHGFAVVAMQAGVALLVFDEQPEQARKSLEAIQATSAKSLTELRTMLDTFHRNDSAAEGEEPPPAPADRGQLPDLTQDAGLAGLGELVEQVRAGGLPVELEMENMDTELAGDIDVVAYRVVQESLTNVLRHAGPTSAGVHIVRSGDELLVQVVDRGCGSAGEQPAPGRGLTGMRGRVEDVGGRLEAGPREGGGFRVSARLPLAGGAR